MKKATFYSFCYYYYIVCLMVILLVYESAAEDYSGQLANNVTVDLNQLANTITVDLNGAGDCETVQSAIDSIPDLNQDWIRILIKSGTYIEKVTIPKDKGFIYMQGEGIEKTIIAYDDHQSTDTSPTFTAFSDDIIISGITIKNTYNIGLDSTSVATPIKPAVAARHYYRRCVISGAIDFIFGYAQTIFEKCTVNVTVGIYAPDRAYGTITAQGRQSPTDNGGFVFKDCTVTGNGKALLGRAWEPYARVIFYRSNFCDSILPIGWDAWRAKGKEGDTTFVEYGCTGAGSDTSQRVPWLKKDSENEVLSLTNVNSIDQDYWLNRLPINYNIVCMVVTLLMFGSAAAVELAYTITVDSNGEGIDNTIIEYDDHKATDTSATFTAFADDIVISGVTFKNTYNIPNDKPEIVPAVAARMLGDRYLVTDSSFDGLQDTLFDAKGRHYYKRCIISGGIDFIFGYAQSLFEGCTLNLTLGIYAPERTYGTITAQQRLSPLDNGGFVFSECTVTGIGKTLLGRAWGSNARVIFSGSELSDVVVPIGWDSWLAKGQEKHLTFMEVGCTGAGANTTQRVPWLKKARLSDVVGFVSVSFIDQDDWLSKCPIGLGPYH
ncbi:unnamed protein product [Arabis nemorensis]|uniref:Pectinesterase n=1 Tax=Arabis nemorensis TaxID=586526 RepID=A0A565BQF2_9BRAS|nr:unnamed protein product [Arabis nemorensis]